MTTEEINDAVKLRILAELRAWLMGGWFTYEDITGLLAILLAETLRERVKSEDRDSALASVIVLVRRLMADDKAA